MPKRDDETDERMNDLLAEMAGRALIQACGGTGKIARAAGVEERSARRLRNGHRSNALYRSGEITTRADDPYAPGGYLIVKATLTVLRRSGPLTEARWRRLYRDACRVEQDADGREDVATQAVHLGAGTLEDAWAADCAVLSPLLRRMALTLVGMRMGWTYAEPLQVVH